MAIENLLEELIAAIKENTAAQKTLTELRVEAVETVRKEAEPKTTKKAAAKVEPKEEKPVEPETKEVEDAEVVSETPAETNPWAGVPEIIAAYVGGSTRTEERTARKAKVRALLRHEKIVKAEKADDTEAFDASDIREDAIDLFKSQIEKLTAKGDLTKPEDDLV